jgi:hypothetical protein
MNDFHWWLIDEYQRVMGVGSKARRNWCGGRLGGGWRWCGIRRGHGVWRCGASDHAVQSKRGCTYESDQSGQPAMPTTPPPPPYAVISTSIYPPVLSLTGRKPVTFRSHSPRKTRPTPIQNLTSINPTGIASAPRTFFHTPAVRYHGFLGGAGGQTGANFVL